MLSIIGIFVIIGGAAAYYFLAYRPDQDNSNANVQAVANANTVANSNVNTSVNRNAITNTTSTNRSTNSQLNTNQTTNVNSANTLNTNNVVGGIVGLPSNEELKKINDPDGDGLLSNVESFYGADKNVADTDGDGYKDYAEVIGCYNPAGPGKMTIALYTSYCNAFYDELRKAGLVTVQELQDMCKLWEPTIQKIIASDASEEAQKKIWDPVPAAAICAAYNTTHGIKTTNENFSLCDGSFITAAFFCSQEVY